jgi:hypothetical protein
MTASRYRQIKRSLAQITADEEATIARLREFAAEITAGESAGNPDA